MQERPQIDGGTDIFDSVTVENRGGAGPFVILCDHASNRFPPEFGTLGLSPPERDAHIAWDPGALGVARRLSRQLDAPLVFSTVSRLVIDCNRDPAAPDAILEKSVVSGLAIPGNSDLTEGERLRRAAVVHAPYHAAIERLVDGRLAARIPTAVVAVHSFTPILGGVSRPWEIGILFDRNRRLADVLIGAMQSHGLNVGINQPYSPADRVYYTLSRHAEARGLDCVMIEIRNDLLRSEAAEADWAARIAGLLYPACNAARPRAAAG